MFGRSSEDAASATLPKVGAVLLRLEPHQGEAKAVLTTDLAMTAPSVTSVPGEKGNNFVDEANRSDGPLLLYGDLPFRAGGLSRHGRDGCGSVFQGSDISRGIDFDDAFRDAGVGCAPGLVLTIVEQDQLMSDVRANESDGGIFTPTEGTLRIRRTKGEEEKGEQTNAGEHEFSQLRTTAVGCPHR